MSMIMKTVVKVIRFSFIVFLFGIRVGVQLCFVCDVEESF